MQPESTKEDERKSAKKQGLTALVAGSILQLFFGTIYVWNIFVDPVHAWLLFDDIYAVKLTSSFMPAAFVAGILTGGRLQTKLGTHRVTLIGGCLFAAGIFMTAFVPHSAEWLIYITYGVIGGFGVGMGYTAAISSAQKWFPKKRGLVTGISVCAFGLSAVIFPPLIDALMEMVSMQTAFLILSAVFLTAALSLFHFVRLPQKEKMLAALPPELLFEKQYSLKEMLKTKEFYLISLSLFFGTAAYFVLNPSVKVFARGEYGYDDTFGTALIMIAGAANAAGRFIVPLLSDRIGRRAMGRTTVGLSAVCAPLLLSGFTGSAPLFAVSVIVVAFSFGGYCGVFPVLTADYFGGKNVGSNYGAVMTGFALSAIVFPLWAGQIESVSAKFVLVGILTAIAAFIAVFLVTLKQKEKAPGQARTEFNPTD